MRRLATDRSDETLALIVAGSDHCALMQLAGSCALPFGADHRVIDFPVSNCLASGLRRIGLLTSGKPHALVAYAQQCAGVLAPVGDEFVEIWPAQRSRFRSPFCRTIDMLLQNLELIEELAPERVLLLSGSHVYRADYRPMLEAHAAHGGGVTIGCLAVPAAAARECDVATLDALGRVLRIDEKSARRRAFASEDPATALVPMGVYAFDRDLLIDCLTVDAADECSSHDFTCDVLPLLIRANGVQAHVLEEASSGSAPFWRNVDTVDSYWHANMDLLSEGPRVGLLRTPFAVSARPAPRFVGEGSAVRSIIAGGCAVEGSVQDSLLSADCRVRPGAVVASSIVLPGARIGRDCRVRKAIVGAGCILPDATVIGEDPLHDAQRFTVSPGGVAVVTADKAARPGLRTI